MTEEAQPTTMSAHAALTRAKAAERRVEELTADRDEWHGAAGRWKGRAVRYEEQTNATFTALRSAGIETDDPAAGVRELAAQRDRMREALVGILDRMKVSHSSAGTRAVCRDLAEQALAQPPSDKAPAPEPVRPQFKVGDRVRLTCTDSPGTGTVAGVYAINGVSYSVEHDQLGRCLAFGYSVVEPAEAPAPEPDKEPSGYDGRCESRVLDSRCCKASGHGGSHENRKREWYDDGEDGEPAEAPGPKPALSSRLFADRTDAFDAREPAEAELSAPDDSLDYIIKCLQGFQRTDYKSRQLVQEALRVAIQLANAAPRTPETAEPAPTRDEPRRTQLAGGLWALVFDASTIEESYRACDSYAPDLAAAQETIRRLTTTQEFLVRTLRRVQEEPTVQGAFGIATEALHALDESADGGGL